MDTHKIFLRLTAMIIGAILLASPMATSAQPAPPVYGCSGLRATQVTPHVWQFDITAQALGGAMITGYSLNPGTGEEVLPPGSSSIQHDYTSGSVATTYTVVAYAHFIVNDIAYKATSDACSVTISVPPSANGRQVVTYMELSMAHSDTICYGSILSLHGSSYTIEEAGLVEYSPDGLTLSHSYTEWGACVIDGKPTTLTRFLGGSHIVYVTACDSMSTLGGMHVSLGFTGDGIKEANTGYLIHLTADRPCEERLPVLVTESGSGWYRTCLERSILVAPSESSPALFRCDPPV